MAVVTAEEITNLYLYGQKTVPVNLVSDVLIRPENVTTSLEININDYMGGPGRFATAEKFDLIKEFFNPKQYELSSSIAPGRYNKKQMMEFLGFTINGKSNRFAGIEISQALLDDNKDDFLERAYVWNTVSFKLHEDVSFDQGVRVFGVFKYSDPLASKRDAAAFAPMLDSARITSLLFGAHLPMLWKGITRQANEHPRREQGGRVFDVFKHSSPLGFLACRFMSVWLEGCSGDRSRGECD